MSIQHGFAGRIYQPLGIGIHIQMHTALIPQWQQDLIHRERQQHALNQLAITVMNSCTVARNGRNTATQLFQVSANIHKVPAGRDNQMMTPLTQFIQRANRQR